MDAPADEKPPTGSAGDRLRQAAEKGDVAAAQAALEEGADPLAHVLGTLTALHVAAKDGKTKVVRFLLEKFPYASDLLRDVHFVARGSVRGRAEVVELIEEALEDACRREQGLPPASRPATVPFVPHTPQEALFFAIHEDDVAAARRALEEGAEVNLAAGTEGMTPLMAAARSGGMALVELLLEKGADPLPTYVGGNRASDLAGYAKYYEISAVLCRAEAFALLKAQQRYLRHFAHSVGGRTGEERFIFYAGGRFLSACWAVAGKRVEEVRWWTEAEFRELLSHGQYGGTFQQYFGGYKDIPERVREEAPARAERSEEILRRLADGTRQLVLERSWRSTRSPRWFLRRQGEQWLLVMGRDLTPISAERARDEVEETLRGNAGAEIIPVDDKAVRRAATVVERAHAALRRLHAGEIWTDGNKLHFAHDGKLYFGLRKGKRGTVESASEQTGPTIFAELVGLYARGGRPQIARDAKLHAQAAPLVEEEGFLDLLEGGKIALGWNDARLYRGEDGKLVRSGLSGTEEVSRPELLEILRSKRYAWVEKRRQVRPRAPGP